MDDINGFDDYYPDREIVSHCCGEPFNEDIGICPECGEYCTAIDLNENDEN